MLLAPPFSAIVYYTFQDGVQPVWEALTDESPVAALKLTLIAVLIAVPANTIFGVACAMALVRRPPKHGTWLINSDRAAARALPGRRRPRADPRLRPGRLAGSWLTENGIQIIFDARDRPRDDLRDAAFVVREVIPPARSGPTRTCAACSARRAFRPSGASRSRQSAGASPTASSSRRRRPGRVRRRRGRLRRIAGKTETLTLHVEEYSRFNEVAAYTTALVLALLAVLTLIAMNLFKPKEHKEVADVDRRPPGHEAV